MSHGGQNLIMEVTESVARSYYYYGGVGRDIVRVKFGESDPGLVMTITRYEYDGQFTAWTYVALVLDASSAQRRLYSRIWKSATLMTSDTAPAYSGSGELRIGGGFEMEVDDIHLFTRVLSPAEIESMSAALQFDRSGLVLLVHFHHQEAWTYAEYSSPGRFMSLTETSFSDFNGVMVGSGWKLQQTQFSWLSSTGAIYEHSGGFHLWGGVHAHGCVCNAGHSRDNDNGACVPCPIGTYKSFWESSPSHCSDCIAGRYSQLKNTSLRCLCCSSGKYGTSMGDESVCNNICRPGEYSTGCATACTRCAAGSYQSLSQSNACLSCPGGKAGTVENATSEASGCSIHCEAGKYSRSRNGYYPYPTVCSNCQAGTYGSLPLASSCVGCPYLSISPAGSTNFSQCSCLP